jgi:hypothetical protein
MIHLKLVDLKCTDGGSLITGDIHKQVTVAYDTLTIAEKENRSIIF